MVVENVNESGWVTSLSTNRERLIVGRQNQIDSKICRNIQAFADVRLFVRKHLASVSTSSNVSHLKLLDYKIQELFL